MFYDKVYDSLHASGLVHLCKLTFFFKVIFVIILKKKKNSKFCVFAEKKEKE